MKWLSYLCSPCKCSPFSIVYLSMKCDKIRSMILDLFIWCFLFSFLPFTDFHCRQNIQIYRLYTRDPHQLFELLCIQLRCISIAYSDGLKQMLKTNGEDESPTYNPVELLTCEYYSIIWWWYLWRIIIEIISLFFFLCMFVCIFHCSHFGWLW